MSPDPSPVDPTKPREQIIAEIFEIVGDCNVDWNDLTTEELAETLTELQAAVTCRRRRSRRRYRGRYR